MTKQKKKMWIALKKSAKGKDFWEPVEITSDSFLEMLTEATEYSTYPGEDDRFEIENARIYFDKSGKYFKGYYIVDSVGIIADHAIFAYEDNAEAAEHFIEISEKLHKQEG